MLKIRTILCPTDFSPYSRHAWEMACALARDYGARIVLLHVREIPTGIYGEFGAIPAEPYEVGDINEQLAAFKPPYAQVKVEPVVAQGNPAPTIVEIAKERGCDLIVMGSHGRTGLGRLLMGSVAETVVRRAGCPVLTLRSPMPEAAPALMCANTAPAVTG
jgi:nucleotide-binding universal stress UspA family protein